MYRNFYKYPCKKIVGARHFIFNKNPVMLNFNNIIYKLCENTILVMRIRVWTDELTQSQKNRSLKHFLSNRSLSNGPQTDYDWFLAENFMVGFNNICIPLELTAEEDFCGICKKNLKKEIFLRKYRYSVDGPFRSPANK